MSSQPHKLGRLVAHDERDENYLHPLAVERAAVPAHNYRYWYNQFNQDQTGDTCVANGCTHFLGDSPFIHRLSLLDSEHPGYVSAQSDQTGFRGWVYDQAQQVDEFAETPPQGGTSVRAGFKALQKAGKIGEYQWLSTSSGDHGTLAVVTCILDERPVVIGVEWYQGMMDVKPGGILTPTGQIVGGHCVCLDGANWTQRKVRVQTWGTHFYMSFATLQQLLVDNGEACTAVEVA